MKCDYNFITKKYKARERCAIKRKQVNHDLVVNSGNHWFRARARYKKQSTVKIL